MDDPEANISNSSDIGNMIGKFKRIAEFKEIWKNNDVLNALRNKEILDGHFGNSDSRNICGGCRARAYTYFNDIPAPDHGCVNNEKEWEMLRNRIFHENNNSFHPEGISINLEARKYD